MFPFLVTQQLDSWPKKEICERTWCKLGRWNFENKAGDTANEGHMFPLFVTEQLDYWPENEIRERTWHDISASDSLSLRVFKSWGKNISSWFHCWGTGRSVSVNLPENWYVRDNFLVFAICHSGRFIGTRAYLIPLCNDGMPWITQKLALCNHSECDTKCIIYFSWYLLLAYGIHLRQMEKHQMTLGFLGYAFMEK
ncbi:uncharacterized protein LOC132058894 isoform X2 [Lycium ferocissimum]|nr:uncharacterized protein LOC132058894 isoform X2 [Lycium ferocissimum]XP_059307294.1 uncharacterized protein LOC132058894 isoform X2 [Lycium ferocissimum]